jgi:hypothetical protein
MDNWSTTLSGELSASADFTALEKTLARTIDRAQSLTEIEGWLKSQPGVQSVQLADYLLKSNPPQREFIVEFKTVDSATVTKIVNIFDLGDQRFRFHTIRDR